jgi:hypothetical protein
MLECLNKRVQDLRPDGPQGTRLTAVPILGPSRSEPAYQILTPANLDKIQVTEISDAGSVQVLKVINLLPVSVFLMDGQELIGAKQNRILNTDVMVPAGATINIPVSCVEQHRWHHTSDAFSPGRSASHRIRKAKAERVRASLRENRGHDANQTAVWDEVAQTSTHAGAASPTGALADAYQHREEDLNHFRTEIKLPDETVGAAVFRRGELLGLDLFDRHSTLAYFWSGLADSYAIDALAEPIEIQGAGRSVESGAVRAVLDQVAAGRWESFATPGEGRDWRLDDPRIAAAALVCADDAVIHLQVFPKDAANPEWRPRIRRPYPRR